MSETVAQLELLTAALADRYRLERPLGHGGMATVYLAHDLKHNREVALKVLKPEFAEALGAQRFLKEIQLTAQLQHSHILPLFDSGSASGVLFYVMPRVRGESLRDLLQRNTRLGLAETNTPLQLSNPPHMELVQLASGNQLLTVAGRVINPTDKPHPVPPIYAQLYDRGGKVIYRWTIAPPTPTLGPGASASFNSAEVNVPSGAEGLTISLGPPKA